MTIGDDGIASICMGKEHLGDPCERCDHTSRELITVLDVTYINTAVSEPPRFIGLWYKTETKVKLATFALDRTDILAIESGDKGYLVQNGEWLDFVPRGH